MEASNVILAAVASSPVHVLGGEKFIAAMVGGRGRYGNAKVGGGAVGKTGVFLTRETIDRWPVSKRLRSRI
jgi:hypothetical protein